MMQKWMYEFFKFCAKSMISSIVKNYRMELVICILLILNAVTSQEEF